MLFRATLAVAQHGKLIPTSTPAQIFLTGTLPKPQEQEQARHRENLERIWASAGASIASSPTRRPPLESVRSPAAKSPSAGPPSPSVKSPLASLTGGKSPTPPWQKGLRPGPVPPRKSPAAGGRGAAAVDARERTRTQGSEPGFWDDCGLPADFVVAEAVRSGGPGVLERVGEPPSPTAVLGSGKLRKGAVPTEGGLSRVPSPPFKALQPPNGQLAVGEFSPKARLMRQALQGAAKPPVFR